jgi:hypothetical protein
MAAEHNYGLNSGFPYESPVIHFPPAKGSLAKFRPADQERF